MSDRIATKRDLKRQRILEAAKRRFSRFGIRATTMQDIARDADIAVGTIYQFFPDKDSLVLAWLGEHRQLIHSQFSQSLQLTAPSDEKLREFLRVRFRTVQAVREVPAISELARALPHLDPNFIHEMTGVVLTLLRTILQEGRDTGVLPSVRPVEDADILFHAVSGFFPSVDDPVTGPPQEAHMLRVLDWFIAQWKLPRPNPQS